MPKNNKTAINKTTKAKVVKVKKADPELKKRIENILRKHFPKDTVDISDGYSENIHIVVVSRKFDGKKSAESCDMIWAMLDETGILTDEEQHRISLILPYSPAELK